MRKRILALVLCTALSLGLTACGGTTMEAEDLTRGIAGEEVSGEVSQAQRAAGASAVTAFGLDLLRETMEAGENTLLSPVSVYCALSMTANGARGDTLSQMDALLGGTPEERNAFLHHYTGALPGGKTYETCLANSIWIRDNGHIQVEEDFLTTNVSWYDAAVYAAPFDASTVKDINGWISENTKGRIHRALTEIPEDAVLYLINALSFDAEWESIYEDYQVMDGIFTREDGTQQDVDMMYSEERIYLEDEGAQGVVKYYDDRAYAFVALVPREGVLLEDYIRTLDEEGLRAMLADPWEGPVQTRIPRFSTRCSQDLGEVLQSMGMTDAFLPERADLSAMGATSTGFLFIDQVIHQTYLSVDERGTEAGAVTVIAAGEGEEPPPEEIRTVELDRPFLYFILDAEEQVPLFLGTVYDIGAPSN